MWRKGNTPTLLVGMSIGTTTMENSTEVSQKTKYRTTIRSSNPTPGHIYGQNYNGILFLILLSTFLLLVYRSTTDFCMSLLCLVGSAPLCTLSLCCSSPGSGPLLILLGSSLSFTRGGMDSLLPSTLVALGEKGIAAPTLV